MGKTKQAKEKKFDRNVEISAPILDPEVIKQIHSPPREQKLDIRSSGFKALLSDMSSQDSTDEVVQITETSHLPSYIGISCAVSGYSNYSVYSRKPLDDSDQSRIESTKQSRLTSGSNQTGLSSSLNRSQTSSPITSKFDVSTINHITIDRSRISSPDQERKELTEKLTASASERRRSPSPIIPIEDGRHHGAYVGARYCPMPPPSKLVHKHIPLLGIDDDQDPDEVIIEDVNKVEEKIATLYGDDFAEDWKESMSHKSKKEHDDEQQKTSSISKNPKDLVTLKPTPVKPAESGNDNVEVIDVPTPNVKVLHSVEKGFLNRLLTDENPPMPKSPSPIANSPVSSPKLTRQQLSHQQQQQDVAVETEASSIVRNSQMEVKPESSEVLTSNVSLSETEIQRSPTPTSPTRSSPMSPDSQKRVDSRTSSIVNSPEPILVDQETSYLRSEIDEPTQVENSSMSPVAGQQQDAISNRSLENSDSPLGVSAHQPVNSSLLVNGQLVSLDSGSSTPRPHASPELHTQSLSTQSDITSDPIMHAGDSAEQHIEYEIRESSPIENQSSPVKFVENSPVQEGVDEKQTEYLLSSSSKHAVEDTIEVDLMNVSEGGRPEIQYVSAPVDPTTNTDGCSQDQRAKGEREGNAATTGNDDGPENDANNFKNGNSNKDGHYYLHLLKQEESFISEQVKLAENMLAEGESEMDEDSLGRIRSAIGKANLLINKKCNQFRELCEKGIRCDANDQFAVLNDDLAGFWDMLCIQIDDVRKSLVELNKQ